MLVFQTDSPSLWSTVFTPAISFSIIKTIQTCDSEDCLNAFSTDAVVDHAQVLPAVLHHRLLDDQSPSHLSHHRDCQRQFCQMSMTCLTLSSSLTSFLLLFDFMNLYHLQRCPMLVIANWSFQECILVSYLPQ